MTLRAFIYEQNLSPDDRTVVKKWHPCVLAFYVAAIILTLTVSFAVHQQPTSVDTAASVNALNH